MKNALTFLRKIKKNNNVEWMHTHRDEYLAAKSEFEFLVQELIVRLSLWEGRFEHLEPKNVMFRINRDIRFSNNKNPYKESFSAYFGIGGKKSDLPGYYLQVSPKEVFVAAGLWHPGPEVLARVRRHISHHGEDLEKILNNKKLKKEFGVMSDESALKRVPKGFDPESKFAEILKMKSFVLKMPLVVSDVTQKNFGVKVDKIMKELQPLVKYLESALSYREEDLQINNH
jgi:uncharacterized protein (TIGR02453 family)